MKVAIFGATGFSGRAILAEVLKQGHEVSILVRNKSTVSSHDPNLTILEGNVMDSKAVAATIRDCDAVIQCLGIGGKGDGKPNTFVSDATKIIIAEMEQLGLKRLIAMSNVGAGNSIAFWPWIFRKMILPYFMKWLVAVFDDKNRMEPAIMNSTLDWTIVRCPNILDKPAKETCHTTLDGKGLTLSITLPDMAKFIVDQLVQQTFIKQAPSISN
jgi:putative NADH-flavin reductase